jgi:acyl-coenzyme A synthetase/AMP-(fatty) acid ligase
MSNFEYDKLYDELVTLEEETGTVLANSPTINVGYEAVEELPKEAHETPMLSLGKTKDREELKSWLQGQKGLLSWKLDGLTVVLTYNNGQLQKAVTRGNGEVGEVVIVPDSDGRQPGVFTAYLDNEEQYSYVWRDGVYHTGDAAYMDENGRYWFHGRFDDIIKTGGFRVGPYEVENVLMEHPAVVECSVIGVPDTLRGQALKAVIVLGAGYISSQELALEIKNFCNQKLAEYKWIRLIEFVTEMPKTISGKIQKTVLRGQTSVEYTSHCRR